MVVCPKCGSERTKVVGKANTKPILVLIRCTACGHTSTATDERAYSIVDAGLSDRGDDYRAR